MGRTVTLPVIIPRVAGQRWACHSCGDCCRSLVVHLTPMDRRAIDEQGWSGELSVEPYVRLGRGWALNKRDDGACVFLDAENRCRIHARYGADAKPLACRVYPFSLRRADNSWQASLRYDCPSALLSKGDTLNSQRAAIGSVAAHLGYVHRRADLPVIWQRGVPASTDELEALDRGMLRWFRQDDISMQVRLRGAARITTTLFSAKLKRVRGARLIELIDLLFGALQAEAIVPVEPATARQRAFVRQIAFAHSEHLSLREIRQGAVHRLVRRLDQLRRARKFRVGAGLVPAIPGIPGSIAFDDVERVKASSVSRTEIDELILRYVTARIETRSVYGGGYYGWPVATGYAALWLALATVAWLARLHAAVNGSVELSFTDVAGALAIVDRAATRLPALGTQVERTRTSYLVREDGLGRLLDTYALTTQKESE